MTKFYRISLSGYGGEFIFLEISKGAHDFWKEQSEEDLVEYCLYPEDQTVKAEADFLYNAATGRHDQRYDADDVQTIVGISADTKCYLNVSEVSDETYDARELKRIIKTKNEKKKTAKKYNRANLTLKMGYSRAPAEPLGSFAQFVSYFTDLCGLLPPHTHN